MYIEKLRLDGKVAMVVGAGGGGHGTASSIALAEAGADIVAIDIDREALVDIEARAAKLGRRCLAIAIDVRKRPAVASAVQMAVNEFGGIHGLVNIVGGVRQFAGMLDFPEQAFDDIMDLNLRYAFLTCQAVARTMVERKIGGGMVNVSSVSAYPSAPSHGPYGAAKAALNAMSRTMALEWSQYGIRVNAVAPGKMWVPRHSRAAGTSGEQMQTYDQAIARRVVSDEVPLGYQGSAADIASAVLYLLSDLSAYVTGQVLVVDGGLSAKSVLTGPAVRQL